MEGLPDWVLVGTGVDGDAEGAGEDVGESVGWGPGRVGAMVGDPLRHLSAVIPKQAIPSGHPLPLGQGVVVMQFASASS